MTDSNPVQVRVWIPDVWDNLTMTVVPNTKVSQLKEESLVEATRAKPDVAQYLVKYRGAHVLDENQTMKDLGVMDGAPFIVLPINRRPVR